MSKGENMVERCARAIYEMEPRRKAWAEIGQHQAYYFKRARAVIDALMTPTPEMVREGAFAAIEASDQDDRWLDVAERSYRAMLRTILSQPNDEGGGK